MPKVFLSAGHGGADPGAVGFGMREKDINLAIVLACRDALVQSGVEVVCSRISDVDDTVYDEVIKANCSGADLAFSVHTNAGGGKGFEVYHYGSSDKGKRLAQLTEAQMRAVGQTSRGVKDGSRLWFLRKTTMPSVLAEGFFIDNKSDVKFGNTAEKQKQIGIAYAKAILAYFGISEQSKNTAAEIAAVLNQKFFPIDNMENFVAALAQLKGENSPAYWGYWKLVNQADFGA